jgi:hypothetical protein
MSFTEYFTPDTYAQAARCYGPFMRKWNYDFPPEWGSLRIPKLSEIQFWLLDRAAACAAQYFTLDPDNRVLHRAKKASDFLTSRP